MKLLSNFSVSKLFGTLASGGTSFSITSGDGILRRFPDRNFDIAIYPTSYRSSLSAMLSGECELINVGARSSDAFSGLTRGVGGTTAIDFIEEGVEYVVELVQIAETIQDLPAKHPAIAATTANITLSGTQTIDGVALSVGDRVLVKNQNTSSQNGIYDVASGAWARAEDFDNSRKVYGGSIVPVLSGTVNGGSAWIVTSTGTLVPGTNAIDFSKIAAKAGVAYGLATLGSDGKIPDTQLPDLSISDYLGSVASQVAMLLLTGQRGDWCTRSDTGTNFIIVGTDPTQLSSWQQLSYPTAPVTSVAGRSGAVTLAKTDVGLENVLNIEAGGVLVAACASLASGATTYLFVGNWDGTSTEAFTKIIPPKCKISELRIRAYRATANNSSIATATCRLNGVDQSLTAAAGPANGGSASGSDVTHSVSFNGTTDELSWKVVGSGGGNPCDYVAITFKINPQP